MAVVVARIVIKRGLVNDLRWNEMDVVSVINRSAQRKALARTVAERIIAITVSLQQRNFDQY